MKLFVSWSGGKDCMLALYRILKEEEHQISYLLNMVDDESELSHSHGLKKTMIAQQADAIGIPILQPQTHSKNYEKSFKAVLCELKNSGIDGGVFGDIYLEAHRTWIERVCKECQITPIFPLWNNNTTDLLGEFVDLGFETITVSVHQNHLTKEWLGRKIDADFMNEIATMPHIDPCAENGEYHSFVFNGPIFNKALPISINKEYADDKHWFIELSDISAN